MLRVGHVLLCAVAATTVVTVGCRPAPAVSPDSTISVARALDAQTLDPARATTAESAEVTEQIFDHLVRYRANSTEVEPALATSWEFSPDGRVWTFHLRKNVRFHDGSTFDADAVVFSFERQRDAKHPFHEQDFDYWNASFRHIMRVDKVDAGTVKITLDRPYAPLLTTLAMFPVAIVSPAALARWGKDAWRHPVGTGPFRFVEWLEGQRITLARNADYWDAPPQFEHLVFVTIRDERQRLAALEGNSIDVAESLSPEDLQFVALHPELALHRVAGNNVGYLAMNTQHPPFNDVRVRRAVNFAINKNAIVKLVYQGMAQAATSPLPPSEWSHVDDTTYSYNRAEATRLLDAAGYVQPPRRPRLYTTSVPRPYMAAPELVARVIQRNLHDVGMDVEVVVNDMKTQIDATKRGLHDLCLLGWSADNGDPDNFLYVLFDSENAQVGNASNRAFFRDDEVDKLLAAAQESNDRKTRVVDYQKVQQRISSQAPWVPLAYAEVVVASRRDLVGLSVHPSMNIYFQHVRRQ